jgi:GDP-L-fucose synthase
MAIDIVLGHAGMVGSAILRQLNLRGESVAFFPRTIDLRDPRPIATMFSTLRASHGGIRTVYLCAARVGGIKANMVRQGEFIYDNLAIQTAVIEACRVHEVKLVVFLGSSCMYPAHQERPWREEDLGTGPLERTNAAYAMAKLAGVYLLSAYRMQYGLEWLCPIPCNLYGARDNFNPETGHFIPAIIRRMQDAIDAGVEDVQLWGSGEVRREAMHVDDCAAVITGLVAKGARGVFNVGPGNDAKISRWAHQIANLIGYTGLISWDASKPAGVKSKLLDVSKLRATGIESTIYGDEGLRETIEWYRGNR